MDFFEAQDSATRRSRKLVLLFGAAVIAIIVVLYVVAHVAVGPGLDAPFDPELFVVVAVLTSGLIAGGSAFRTSQLRTGGATVARLLGGRRIPPDTAEPDERRLVNVVEEMAVASGIPVPAMFVLEDEGGINAFAAGYGIHDAAVAVTRGALQRLNREELQGVMAHEFSHILNGDMRLNIRLIGLLYGILLLAVLGRGMLYARPGGGRRGRGGGGQIALLGFALVLVGYIGVFFGRIIQASVSRQREFLADASAVQFTRNPHGIAGALKKIGGLAFGSRITNHHAQEVSHLFFAEGLASSFLGLFATHPPLEDRIRRVDPSFDGRFEVTTTPPRDEPVRRDARAAVADREAAGAAAAGAQRGLEAVTAVAILSTIGAPRSEHVAHAGRLLESIPEELKEAAHEPEGAQALILALLLSEHGPAPERQASVLEAHDEPAIAARARDLRPLVRQAGIEARLPLLDLALPALRELAPERAAALRRTVRELVRADGEVWVFEYALVRVLERNLGGEAERRPSAGAEIHSLRPLHDDVEAILSAVAWAGTSDHREARAAFERAAPPLAHSTGPIFLLSRDEVPLVRVDAALRHLERASLPVRRRVFEACAVIAAHDGFIRSTEAELLRAIGESLELPVPPPVISSLREKPAAAGP